MRNDPNNRAFGPYGVSCPGALMTVHYIKNVLSFLQELKIEFDGDIKMEGDHFVNIVNKKEVYVTLQK